MPMIIDLKTIDPNAAWSRFEPDAQQPWNRSLAAHLFRRAGFGANSRQLDDAVKLAPADVVQQLVAADEGDEFRRQMNQLSDSAIASNEPKNLAAWWFYRLLHTPHQTLEKVTLFWHGHFATSATKVTDAGLMLDQNRLLRQYALGRFDELVPAIARNPAMLIYLDSATNRKGHPNENFSRELMELFCLGLGNYTEKDIQELARCFTGWEINQKRFRFNRYQHDTGSKTFLGQSGPFAGEDGVRVVLEQAASPQFIVRKLIRYFVCDDVEIPTALVQPLADEFRAAQFQVAPIVEKILSSRLFFSPSAVGRKIRSPVELVVGFLRALEGTTNLYRLAEETAQLGQGLFYPPNVKGWDGGRTWINSSTLLSRSNLVRQLVQGGATRFAGGTLATLLEKQGLSKPDEIVAWLLELLVAVPVPDEARRRVVELAQGPAAERPRQLADAVHAISTLPEFQLS